MNRPGLEGFNFREIDDLIKSGLKIILFPTKFSLGPYMPKPDWECYNFNRITVITKQIYYFIKTPKKYLNLLIFAWINRSILDLMLAFEFAYQMKKRNVDRIHCHFGDHKLFIGYYCKKILNIPLTVTIHAHELYTNPNWIMFKKSLEACETIVSISDYNKNILIKKFGIKDEKIKVIRLFGFDKPQKDPIKILIVGWFQKKKGHDVLFRAVKKLNRGDIEIWVVGRKQPGHVGIDMKELARQLEVEDKVVVFGEVSDEVLKILYSACDIFCLPSKTVEKGEKEGIPVALMEAMSYSKPVISTRHAGIPELVEDILVEENNAKQLAEAIENLIENSNLREELGKRNKEIIKKNYSRENIMRLREVFLGKAEG